MQVTPATPKPLAGAAAASLPLCPVCATQMKSHYCVERFAEPLRIVLCPACGLQSQWPRAADPDDYYDEGYYTGASAYAYHDERQAWHYDNYVWQARLKNIARFVAPPADFLDVGCAFGGLVSAAAGLGYRARGLDVSRYAVEQGRRQGRDLLHGQLDQAPIADGSVDALTMIEVLEHVSDPQQAMRELSRIVRAGGLLVIQTANFLGRQARKVGADYHYYLPGHLHYYSSRNLTTLLDQHGFDMLRVYRPVDFGLLPKLLKSRGSFRRTRDYLRWVRIAWYHLTGKLTWGDAAWTSSMVIYARKR